MLDQGADVRRIRVALDEWFGCRKNSRGSAHSGENVQQLQSDIWKKLEEGCLKINCDGAFDFLTKVGGTGVIVRKCEGVCINGIRRKMKAENALMVEALALKDGVELVVAEKYMNVVFETNSSQLHYIISKGKVEDWRLRPLALDILRLLKLIPNSWFS
ncbi:hypothetical protein REPUB_Repub20aG0026400 [Reevesia pubescens]